MNGFVMVLSNTPRIEESVKQMLREYEILIGDVFWQYLFIVITEVDDEDDVEEFEDEGHIKDIQQILNDKFVHLRNINRNIPVVSIGKKTYSTQVSLIMKAIPKQKFICNALKSPHELLKAKYDKVKTSCWYQCCIG